MNRFIFEKGRTPHPFPVLALVILSVLSLTGCDSQKAAKDSTKGYGEAAPKAGPPPIPDNVPPEIKERIAREQAEMKARSQISKEHATAPPPASVPKK